MTGAKLPSPVPWAPERTNPHKHLINPAKTAPRAESSGNLEHACTVKWVKSATNCIKNRLLIAPPSAWTVCKSTPASSAIRDNTSRIQKAIPSSAARTRWFLVLDGVNPQSPLVPWVANKAHSAPQRREPDKRPRYPVQPLPTLPSLLPTESDRVDCATRQSWPR